jgi:hypothetical protein
MSKGLWTSISILLGWLLRNVLPIVITFAVVIIAYFFTWVDYVTLSIFSLLIFVFSMFKFDPRVLIGYAILLLLITGTLTYLKAADYSIEQGAVISYWLLISAIVYSIIELYRKRKNTQEVIA